MPRSVGGSLVRGTVPLVLLLLQARPASSQATGVRSCRYVPGVSVPAQVPSGLPRDPIPTRATVPGASPVDASKTAAQRRTLTGLWNAVRDHYVYADFRGRDWDSIGARYRALVERGLTDEDFKAAMQAMLGELGDEHSHFQSREQVIEDEAALAGRRDFVGVGALFQPVGGGEHATVLALFPQGPAAQAGLQPHDTMLAVDGGAIRTPEGVSRTLGPEGTRVTLTVERPGEPPRQVTLVRRRVSGGMPIDFCLVPRTRIGYLFLPTFLDHTVADQTRAALRRLNAAGPLEGLVIDNRVNGGGSGDVAKAMMALFTRGRHGSYLSRAGREPLEFAPEDVGGSQSVPLVVLVGGDTVSYAEIFSGVLRAAGRARLVGERTPGNVEQLHRYDFEDGSRAWLASATFEPPGETAGAWEESGLVPDFVVPARWELFTEPTDPGLAKAVELLRRGPAAPSLRP